MHPGVTSYSVICMQRAQDHRKNTNQVLFCWFSFWKRFPCVFSEEMLQYYKLCLNSVTSMNTNQSHIPTGQEQSLTYLLLIYIFSRFRTIANPSKQRNCNYGKYGKSKLKNELCHILASSKLSPLHRICKIAHLAFYHPASWGLFFKQYWSNFNLCWILIGCFIWIVINIYSNKSCSFLM